MANNESPHPAIAHNQDVHGYTDGNFSMDAMASALPNYRTQQGVPSGLSHSQVGPNIYHQQQQQAHSPTFAGQTMGSPGHTFPPQYFPPYHHGHHPGVNPQQFHMNHPGYQSSQHGRGVPSPLQQSYSGPYFQEQQPQSPHYMYYPQAFVQTNAPHTFQGQRQVDGNMYSPVALQPPSPMGPFHGQHSRNINYNNVHMGGSPGKRPNTTPSPNSLPSAPRGPPRKPKQSGHALWVGNLPPGALVNDLKDHFARDATKYIESVFLISKSNCAFVNYRSEEACSAAMIRFHDSRFQGIRLVCRLRRNGGTPSPGVPTGPAALTSTPPQGQTAVEAINHNREVSSRAEESMRQVDGATKINDKYFVVKSLTLEDLELSARNGVWATQGHNEEALNKAFESVDNVYLIFSANKSGEYYGYARMVSDISEEAAKDLNWTPHKEIIIDDPELPRSIPTPATETAPKGHIIDDSARGTIFWEADILDQNDPSSPTEPDSTTPGDEAEANKAIAEDEERLSGPQAFGKPFKIEWMSTNRIPFYRTRGLRNPWNANREIKIARDGTELETSVGRRLVQMFHRTVPSPGAQGAMSPGMSPGMQMPTGYPGHRQF